MPETTVSHAEAQSVPPFDHNNCPICRRQQAATVLHFTATEREQIEDLRAATDERLRDFLIESDAIDCAIDLGCL